MNRFDSLVHVTPDGRWLGKTRHDASLGRLIAEMDRAGVTRACLVGIAGYSDDEMLAAVARTYPDRFVPIVGFNPACHAGPDEIDAAVGSLASRGFAGIKLHPRLNGYDPLESRSVDAIRAAGRHGLPVFLCTFFRRPDAPARNPVEVIDHIAVACPGTFIVLLHGGGTSMLDLFEIVRMRDHLFLDLSFSIMRYAGSSLDLDMRFLFEHLDRRVTVGSDFPEHVPADAFRRVEQLTDGLPDVKRENVAFRNLTNLFEGWGGMPS